MSRLTDAERDELARLFGWVPEPEPLEQMLAAVARIIAQHEAAERERWVEADTALADLRAAVEALADEWDELKARAVRGRYKHAIGAGFAAKRLRALLAQQRDGSGSE